jgi:hypothetical protein
MDDSTLRACVHERSSSSTPQLDRRVLERARRRGETRTAGQPRILGEVASSLLVYRIVCGLPVDDIMLPALLQ